MLDDRPTFGSLFAGIGGMDLGLERAGWRGRWQVEWDPFCQRVLAKHWPNVQRYGDITTVDWSGVERVDLLAGGFPCQPVSVAGTRRAQADDRWLWPEFARAIRDLRPRVVLVENVPGLLARGMGDVLGDLAVLGYDAQWSVISAADVGAPHLRRRVWIVAYAEGIGGELRATEAERQGRPASGRDASDPERVELRHEPGRLRRASGQGPTVAGHDGAAQPLAYPEGEPIWTGLRKGGAEGFGRGRSGDGGSSIPDTGSERGQLSARRRQPAVALARGNGAPGSSGIEPDEWWATEPDVGRVAHGVPSRVDRLRSLGNAVVPQVVEVIGRQLMDAIR